MTDTYKIFDYSHLVTNAPSLSGHLTLLLFSGLPDRNKKLSPNSLQKIAKLSKNSPNFWRWLHLYQNINFFHWKSVVQNFVIFRLVFYQKVYRFSTFCTYFYLISFNILQRYLIRSVQCYASTFKTFIPSFDFMDFQTISELKKW